MKKSAFFPRISEMLREKFLVEEGEDYFLYGYCERFEKTSEECRILSVVSKGGIGICQWYEADVDGSTYLFANSRPKKRTDIGWAWEPETVLEHMKKMINKGNSLQELYRKKLLKIRE
nr:hypothetical protein [Marseillevirus cajuinensis]WRK65331.1 hypothetical protein MarFTME_286 [Marseillevirus futianmevirus]